MNITFDVSFWTLLFNGLTLMLAIYGVIYARSKATTDQIDGTRLMLATALEAHKDQNARSFEHIGQRVQALETKADNAITHHDVGKIYDRLREVDKAVSDSKSEINHKLGKLEGAMDRISNGLASIQQSLTQRGIEK